MVPFVVMGEKCAEEDGGEAIMRRPETRTLKTFSAGQADTTARRAGGGHVVVVAKGQSQCSTRVVRET